MIIKDLVRLADDLFIKKGPLNTLHQEIAENFYPERAEFTVTRSLGTDFEADLTTSFPVLCRRDLANQIGSMLRPKATEWFHRARKYTDIKVEKDVEVRQYLEWFDKTMFRAMYDKRSQFTRATKIADNDFTTFGQFVMSIELSRNRDSLLYRTWNVRDCAWQENAEGEIGFVARRWRTTVQNAVQTFGKDKLSSKLTDKMQKEPFDTTNLLHIVCDAEMYSDHARGRPRWSIWWDMEHEALIEATPIWGRHYIVPRWVVINSQYAFSPATVVALPDARLIQAMAFSLIQASEKASDPPMVAVEEAIRSDLSVWAGGVTWVDRDYDEKLGEVLRPISQDYRGISYGLEMVQDTRGLIREAFFLNSLTPFNPSTDPQMTAFQAGQIVQEYIRKALPIFEPMEYEYSAAMCEETFDLMARNGGFGPPTSWPRQLQIAGHEYEYHFESPLNDVIDKQKGQLWMEAKALLADAVALDRNTAYIIDAGQALRDALEGIGVPANWTRSGDEVDKIAMQVQQAEQRQQLIADLEQGSKAALNMANAQESSAKANVI